MYYYRGPFGKGNGANIPESYFFASRQMKAHFMGESILSRYGGFMLLQLYVNDPLGKRCSKNMSVAADLKKQYDFDLEVVKKSKEEKLKNRSLPLFPAIAIDGKIVAEDRVVSRDELERVITAQ